MFRLIRKLKKRIKFFSLLLIVLAIVHFVPNILKTSKEESTPEGSIKATFVDVGQGGSFLLETSDGKTLLIDGGEFKSYSTHLKPYLESRGIDTVDIAIVSHYHSDHMGGISELVEENKVECLILPDYPDTDNSRTQLEKSAKKTKTDIKYVSAGDRIDCRTQGLLVDAIHPQKGGHDYDNFHNNNSLVFRITYGKTTMLITGDIEAQAEKTICNSNENLECDILQIPHHGSSTSSTSAFLSKTDPTYAVIQSGKNNRYGHPHQETLSALRDEDITLYRNDQYGHITFNISPTTIEEIEYSK